MLVGLAFQAVGHDEEETHKEEGPITHFKCEVSGLPPPTKQAFAAKEMIYSTRLNRLVADRVVNCLANYRMNRGGGGWYPVCGEDNQLERLMARSGDVKNQGVVPKAQKQKRERETGTNLGKMPLKVNKAVTAITWAPIRD
jgi:hypothetical protein